MYDRGLILAACARRHTGKWRQAGITLIELMMVLTIVGILGAIAVPSYTQYTKRAHRTDAKAALMRLAANQERFYIQNHTYGADVTALGFPTALSEHGAYAIAVTAADASSFSATATPVAGGDFDQTSDADCTSFTFNSSGAKTATGARAATCW